MKGRLTIFDLDKLGIITDEVSSSLVDALEWAKCHGLRHVEIRTIDGVNAIDLSDSHLRWIREQVNQSGLFVSCLASPVFKCPLSPSRPVQRGDMFGDQEDTVDGHFEKLQRSIDIAHMLGTRRIRIFSFWRERDPRAFYDEIVRHLREAARVAEERNILLLLENEPSCNGGFAAEVGEFVHAVASPALKVLWDPGNEAYGGRSSFPEGYRAIKEVVAHVHLKDVRHCANGKPVCVPIGSGEIPFIDHFTALQEDGYAGLYTIETHFMPDGGTLADGSSASLAGLKMIVHGE